MKNDQVKIPIIGEHRGVGLHDNQSAARLAIVRGEIDRVLGITASAELFAIAGNTRWTPEARLLAAAKLETLFELAVDERRERPDISLMQVRACISGLNSDYWRSPTHFCSLLDVPPGPGQPGPVERETQLDRE